MYRKFSRFLDFFVKNKEENRGEAHSENVENAKKKQKNSRPTTAPPTVSSKSDREIAKRSEFEVFVYANVYIISIFTKCHACRDSCLDHKTLFPIKYSSSFYCLRLIKLRRGQLNSW